MNRFYYHQSIAQFITDLDNSILGDLTRYHEFDLEEQQKNAWRQQITLLKQWLPGVTGHLILEYSIPRMGKRIDCVIIVASCVFAIEFKVGSTSYDRYAIDQVHDYALDLKNFHAQSHHESIIPILICTAASDIKNSIEFQTDKVANPLLSNGSNLREIILDSCHQTESHPIDAIEWLHSIYQPTPTIIEAAQTLYRGHRVEEISRSDAGAINLSRTAQAISQVIESAKQHGRKSICFLTGVPGAGKTLAGLNLANTWHNVDQSEHAVFLSGNGPLVEVLREALARSEVEIAKEKGCKISKTATHSKVKAFIQNIHHFRDDALVGTKPPVERVVVFDEAQRAWTLRQTAKFMKEKKGKSDFNQSEPEFLISVMDRHEDWAVIICLIGGGQEINVGEAGLQEWFASLRRSFPNWDIHVSSRLSDYEYTRDQPLYNSEDIVYINDDLHLSVSIRSFRSEKVAAFVKAALDVNTEQARHFLNEVKRTYPIYVTRDISLAKKWLRSQARGTERHGIIASSGAIRLKPFGINVKNAIDPKHWFLNEKSDIRSSNFLEDVATEFDVQGLELDWTCIAWDADLRYNDGNWMLKAFRGTAWQEVNDPDARLYLKNAYRVLLTRARQGMVIFVPHGSYDDATRLPQFYDGTYDYLISLGIQSLPL